MKGTLWVSEKCWGRQKYRFSKVPFEWTVTHMIKSMLKRGRIPQTKRKSPQTKRKSPQRKRRKMQSGTSKQTIQKSPQYKGTKQSKTSKQTIQKSRQHKRIQHSGSPTFDQKHYQKVNMQKSQQSGSPIRDVHPPHTSRSNYYHRMYQKSMKSEPFIFNQDEFISFVLLHFAGA